LTFKATGKVDVRASLTLTCGTEYRWHQGREFRGSYCVSRHDPLRLTSDSGVDASATAALKTSVSINGIAGVDGNISATLHAGYHPAQNPVAQLDASAKYDIGACLGCLWKNSPARVTIANGVLFQKTIATYGSAPPPAESKPGEEEGEEGEPPGEEPGGPDLLKGAVEVSSQQAYTCARLDSGRVACWGDAYQPVVPTLVPEIDDAVEVTAGAGFGCARLGTGKIECWGHGGTGQLGNGSSESAECVAECDPTEVAGIETATALDAGWGHVCAVLSSGAVECWGWNIYGQLGIGTSTGPDQCEDSETCSTEPVAVSGLSEARAVSASEYHTCALLKDGTVECWGEDAYFQLGMNHPNEECSGLGRLCSTVPIPVAGVSDAVQISTGHAFSCALLAAGTVRCWGDNQSGQLGDAGNAGRPGEPHSVGNLQGATSVGSGNSHSCAIRTNRTVWCWGGNWMGQLGDNLQSGWASASPVQAVGISTAIDITGGWEHSCSVLAAGGVSCWGSDSWGQLGVDPEELEPICGRPYQPCSPVPLAVRSHP
jgi:alpha-tubulin suppressor-like RCC1 family protein